MELTIPQLKIIAFWIECIKQNKSETIMIPPTIENATFLRDKNNNAEVRLKGRSFMGLRITKVTSNPYPTKESEFNNVHLNNFIHTFL